MKNFKQLIKELPSNKVVVGFGSFQPPTSMHEHLIKSVKRVADKSADYAIYASANEDKKHNPLPVDRKVYFLSRMFPGTKFQETKEQTIVGLAKKLNEKYKNLVVVVGEDKVAETEKQLNKANGKEFTFESIKVVSTGSTDPDSDLSSGVSGLRMCESAKAGKFEDFKKGLPHTLTEHDSRRLMNEVRKGLGQEPIKEVVQFARSTVREQYIAGEIFNVGDKVQDEKGVYEIMDRGANYITVVNESGELSKKWIDKVTAVEVIVEDIPGGYAPEEISFKGYTTKNLHHSADAAKAFQQTINKYEGGLIKDGVAILNALKHTDEYMKLNDTHLEQMKPPIASEVKSWVHAHMKAKESLDRIGEYLHHMDYWDNHGHELQMLMTNYKEEGDPTESLEQEGTMIKENDRKDPETKKVMLRYKDFLKTATMSEPPVEIGAESAAKKVDTKEKDDGRVTQSDQDSKIKQTEPKHVATGFSLTKPFDVNDTLRRQKVKYQLGESYDEAEKHLSLANDAEAKGDKAAFHSHMADHHDAMSEWHESKGRSASADKHAEKADYHHEKSLTVKEDVYTSDTKTKDYMAKDKDGNWVWRKRKIHPKRITFDASKMGAEPAQNVGMDEEVEQIDEISSKLAGNYYGAATKKHLDKVGMKPNMYDRIEKDMGKKRKEGIDRALDRVTGARKTNEEVAEEKDPCWTGYKQLGVKKKNGKTVPNCIPVKEETKTYGSWVLKQKSMISKKEDKKKASKVKTQVSDKEAFDPKNSGGTPPFDPFFSK